MTSQESQGKAAQFDSLVQGLDYFLCSVTSSHLLLSLINPSVGRGKSGVVSRATSVALMGPDKDGPTISGRSALAEVDPSSVSRESMYSLVNCGRATCTHDYDDVLDGKALFQSDKLRHTSTANV